MMSCFALRVCSVCTDSVSFSQELVEDLGNLFLNDKYLQNPLHYKKHAAYTVSKL